MPAIEPLLVCGRGMQTPVFRWMEMRIWRRALGLPDQSPAAWCGAKRR
jgi:hypothetical protein